MSQPTEIRTMKSSVLSDLINAPNVLTALRLCMIPILWVFALSGMSQVVGLGLILAFITDVFDGIVARSTNQVTDFGSKFDLTSFL